MKTYGRCKEYSNAYFLAVCTTFRRLYFFSRKRDTNMVLDPWLGGQTHNPVIKMLKNVLLLNMLKSTRFQPSDVQSSTGENTPLTTQFSWRHNEDRSSGGWKLEFLTFLARERF